MLIGITGKKRAGKDTLAKGLANHFQLKQESFAGPLRNLTAELLGVTVEELEYIKEAPLAFLDDRHSPRTMMQTLGTEWGREMIHPELWVRSLFQRLPRAGAVVCDVRFDNEAQAIQAHGGIILRVVRPGQASEDEHVSELGVSDQFITMELINNSSPEVLIQRAIRCLDPAYV